MRNLQVFLAYRVCTALFAAGLLLKGIPALVEQRPGGAIFILVAMSLAGYVVSPREHDLKTDSVDTVVRREALGFNWMLWVSIAFGAFARFFQPGLPWWVFVLIAVLASAIIAYLWRRLGEPRLAGGYSGFIAAGVGLYVVVATHDPARHTGWFLLFSGVGVTATMIGWWLIRPNHRHCPCP
jgi:hypothetical protein